MKNILTVLAFAFFPVLAATADAGDKKTDTFWSYDIFELIQQVETGGEPNGGRGAVGDGGKSIGPYQIGLMYHTDAQERNRDLDNWKSCLESYEYSERVLHTYMLRYAKSEWSRALKGEATLKDLEKIARIHNGGPRGYKKSATDLYWSKVLRILSK